MGISSIGGAASNAVSTVTNAYHTKPSSTTNPTSASPSGSSDSVTLSPEAQALASLNAHGVTVAQVPLSDLSSVGPAHWIPIKGAGGSISQGDFERIASTFGVSSGEAAQMFKQMDTNNDGALSNAEFIKALGGTSNSPVALSTDLLQMMDANHDGTVTGNEYLNLESAVVQTEK